MDGLLAGKTGVITGAASGNGRGIAVRFAEEGADVVVADIQEEPRLGGTPTHELIAEETDSEARYVECDVTDTGDLEEAVSAANEFGGIDIMVNNAGILGPRKTVTDIEREDYDRVLDINLAGVIFGSQKAARAMIERGEGGNIINLSSQAGYWGSAKGSLYSITKAGVRRLTESLALELGPHDIRVNAIAPGIIETAFTREDIPLIETERGEESLRRAPMDRYGTPEDVGNAAVLLASSLTSYITAHTLPVSGGMVGTRRS